MKLLKNLIRRVLNYGNGPTLPETFVIGTQMAQASAAQRRHEEMYGVTVSPLSDLRYSSIENRLWRWVDSPADSKIERAVTDFAALGEAERNSVRQSLSTDDFYTLITFAWRCALAVLRGSEARQIQPAFGALAMIDLERIDWRDLLTTNSVLCYAGERVRAPVAAFLSQAIMLAKPETAEALKKQRTTRIDLASTCGYREVRTSEGVALFGTGYEHFSPQADLETIAFDSAIALENEGYEIEKLSTATNLPLTWLNGQDGSAIARIVGSLSGCVAIHGRPRADPNPNSSGQMLLVFLAEAASNEDAREIATAAENASDTQRTQLGVASRRLCGVIIQKSWMVDTLPLEDARSLERLRSMFERLLS